ncbi:MAG: leucyl aminopeptidase [Acidimicrobiia bacterium]
MLETTIASRDVDLEGATVIAGVLEGLVPAPGSEEVFAQIAAEAIEPTSFEGKVGQTLTVPLETAAAALLVGLGDEVSFETVRAASGNGVRRVKTERAVTLLAQAGIDGATRATVEGTILGGYRFRLYKTDEEELDVGLVEIVDADPDEFADAVVLAESTLLARDWVNTPAMDKAPERLAGLFAELAGAAGIDAAVWDRKRITEEGLGALLGVAAGSDRDPRLVVLDYTPEEPVAHLALVGKGITFDSGGLSLKPSGSMEEMKDDMAGAAAVVAATIGIAQLELPVKVTTITPLTDNAVGGDATRPGDVLRPVDGPTIEVLNTDAEGRLVLADGLGLAKRHEPDLTIDVATLTGAAAVALGKKVAAVFGSDADTAQRVLRAAGRAGEEFWEMPLFKGYRKSIESNIADVKNISGSRYGAAIVAALFLAEYAGDGPWAHLDIAGPARSEETSGEAVKGASGVAVRTLIELARSMADAS